MAFREKLAGWWWWHVSRKLNRERVVSWIAWNVPRDLAYWCFVRVNVAANPQLGPSEEYARVAKAWESGAGR